MPWNEPGNSRKNKDPWTGRPKQTPPDLEAFLRDLLKKIAALFKLKSPNKNASILTKTLFPPQLNAKIIGVIVGLLLLAWLLSGFFTVNPSEQAVVTRFGQYIATLAPGHHWIFKPIESRYVIHTEKNASFFYQKDLLTRDEARIAVVATLHYAIVNARQYLFSNTQALHSLQALTANTIQQTLGQLSLEQLLTANLFSLQYTLQMKINQSLSKYGTGLALSDIELQPIQVPEALKASFADVQHAQADKKQLENQAKIYALQLEPTAKDQTERLIADAKAYQQAVIVKAKTETTRFLALLPAYEASPILMRKRLYLEAMQVMMAHSNKILVDNPSNASLSFSLNNANLQDSGKTNDNNQANKKPSSTQENLSLSNTSKTLNTANTMPNTYDITGGYE